MPGELIDRNQMESVLNVIRDALQEGTAGEQRQEVVDPGGVFSFRSREQIPCGGV